MRAKFLFFLVVLHLIVYFSCKKDRNEEKDGSNPLKIINNPDLANKENELLAYYSKPGDSVQLFYYGSFDGGGRPKKIDQMVFQKNSGETVNLFFDGQNRASSFYISKLGVKYKMLISFDYGTPGKTIAKLYSYDFDTNISTLISSKALDNASGKVSKIHKLDRTQMHHASLGNIDLGIVSILKFIMPQDDIGELAMIANMKLVLVNAALPLALGLAAGLAISWPVGVAVGVFAWAIAAKAGEGADIVKIPKIQTPNPPGDPLDKSVKLFSQYGGGIVYYIHEIKNYTNTIVGIEYYICSVEDLGYTDLVTSLKLAKDYRAGAFSDWHLPSIYENYELYSARKGILNIHQGCRSTQDQDCFYWIFDIATFRLDPTFAQSFTDDAGISTNSVQLAVMNPAKARIRAVRTAYVRF
ncbi:hypothetical protein WAE58_21735 [Pedobacter panaciterrae]|uniref:DUF1566 domain-containing protein n=1 Tax=Pedobacter panaciterrae TaxID=363849 RepID=A0ABU8NS55_9SPHI